MIATDNGDPSESTRVDVKVKVDRNPTSPKFVDNAPKTIVSEYVTVGSEVIQMEASDPDSIQVRQLSRQHIMFMSMQLRVRLCGSMFQGFGSGLLFELQSGDLDFFVIHPRTGSVHVARSLAEDPYLNDSYSVNIDIRDVEKIEHVTL